MSYGLRTWSDAGVLELDTDSFTYQVLHNQQYRLGSGYDGTTINVSIPEFNTTTCVAAVLPIGNANGEYAASALPYVVVSNGLVSVRSKNPGAGNTYGSLISFRLLVMRYKN